MFWYMKQHIFMEENICKTFIEENMSWHPSNMIFWQWLFMVCLCTEIRDKAYIFKNNARIAFAN